MASLERWKCSCLVVFALICTNLALELSHADAKLTRSAAPFFPVSLNCPLLGRPELAALKSGADEVCLSPSAGPSLFCQTLLNVTRLLCELDAGGDGAAEIVADTFKNISLTQQDLCSLVVALPADNRTPMVDAVRTVVVGTNHSQANVTCARQCNGTAHILCNFMLLVARILKPNKENVILAPNTVENISAAISSSTKIVSTGGTTGVEPIKAGATNRTLTTTTSKNVVVPAAQDSGLNKPKDDVALGPAAVVSESVTARSQQPIDPVVTKVTSSSTASDPKTSKSPVPAAIGGSEPEMAGQPDSTAAASGRRNSSTTTSRTPPAAKVDPAAAAAPVPLEPFDDFPNTGDEIAKDGGQVAAATVRYPPGADFEVDGPGDAGNNIPLQNEDDYGEEQPPLVDKTPNEINDTPVKSVPQKHGTFSIAYPDGSGSGFLPVFFMFIILSISLYFVYHYRNKIMGLLLEGRSERRRRPNTNQYRRLSNKLEDVLPVDAESGASKRVANVIY